MSLKKRYLEGKSVCKVTFILPKEVANLVGTAHVAGDFNDWNRAQRLRDGELGGHRLERGERRRPTAVTLPSRP